MPDLHGTFGLASNLSYAVTNKKHQLIYNGFKWTQDELESLDTVQLEHVFKNYYSY